MKRLILGWLFAILSVSFAFAACPSGTYYTTTGNNCILVSPTNPLPIIGTATSTPSGVTTTVTNATIAITNTFQTALASSLTRKSCLVQNQGTHVMYFYFGAIASATTSNSLQINGGNTISCATVNGLVLTDAVNITGTAGDAFVVTAQ